MLHCWLKKSRFLLRLLDPEDDGATVPRNVRNYTPNDTAPHPSRLESSAACCENLKYQNL